MPCPEIRLKGDFGAFFFFSQKGCFVVSRSAGQSGSAGFSPGQEFVLFFCSESASRVRAFFFLNNFKYFKTKKMTEKRGDTT
jgi:hypothetical protein